MSKFRLTLFIACLFGLHAAVAQSKKMFSALPSSVTGVNFKNTITEDENMYYYTYEYLYNGAGVSVGDFNNDGLPDLYFTSSLGSDKLYLNEGNFHFNDITASAGVDVGTGMKTGVNIIEINNEGYMDI